MKQKKWSKAFDKMMAECIECWVVCQEVGQLLKTARRVRTPAF